jgi:chromosome segregation ATPase
MMKKGLLGAALAAGGLYLVFGTAAPSYVRTAYHKVRHSAKDAVPIQFEIDRARDVIAALEPAILENREILARAEVDVEDLQKQITDVEKTLDGEKHTMMTLREGIETGNLRLAKNSSVRYTVDEAKADLAGRLDHYKYVCKMLEDKRTTLKAKEKAVQNARAKLTEMANTKRSLGAQLEKIKAQVEAIESTQAQNEFTFDDSALSRAKQSVAELETRLKVKSRVAEMEGRYPADSLPIIDSNRDVIKEFDAEFSGSTKDAKIGGDRKSL